MKDNKEVKLYSEQLYVLETHGVIPFCFTKGETVLMRLQNLLSNATQNLK